MSTPCDSRDVVGSPSVATLCTRSKVAALSSIGLIFRAHVDVSLGRRMDAVIGCREGTRIGTGVDVRVAAQIEALDLLLQARAGILHLTELTRHGLVLVVFLAGAIACRCVGEAVGLTEDSHGDAVTSLELLAETRKDWHELGAAGLRHPSAKANGCPCLPASTPQDAPQVLAGMIAMGHHEQLRLLCKRISTGVEFGLGACVGPRVACELGFLTLVASKEVAQLIVAKIFDVLQGYRAESCLLGALAAPP
mmetsp:Transcript_50394/g.109433  ORF Transcript_50394/g.109433 Transcript_50394/m.109433 type:complete len:251 (-) Transcript_50394:291-1043(-)